MNTTGSVFLQSVIKRVTYYKQLSEHTFNQLEEKDFYFQPNTVSNSLVVIIQHMSGNMLSRWTNFLTEDGEKSWRSRDMEFEDQHGKACLLKKNKSADYNALMERKA